VSVYFKRGKGWRVDFTLGKKRHTKAWFTTKREAQRTEAAMREELTAGRKKTVQTVTGFLELLNNRLDFMKNYDYASSTYDNFRYSAKRWLDRFGDVPVSAINFEAVEAYLVDRKNSVSPTAANVDLSQLKALFCWAREPQRRLVTDNPVEFMKPFPRTGKSVGKKVPTPVDLDALGAVARPDDRDYLVCARETMARSIEINRLEWDDVDFKAGTITLWTRKRKSRELTPRTLPLTEKLREVLTRRFARRNPERPEVFHHTYRDRKAGEMVTGPYKKRRKLMPSLCERAGLDGFRLHDLRRSGASLLDEEGVEEAAIQRVLGHKSRESTRRYLKRLRALERGAMKVFEQASRDFERKSHIEPSHNDQGRTDCT